VWRVGFVTQLEPLEVKGSGPNKTSKGHPWHEVRKHKLVDEEQEDGQSAAAAKKNSDEGGQVHNPDAENRIVEYMGEMCKKVPDTIMPAYFVRDVAYKFCGTIDQERGKGTAQGL